MWDIAASTIIARSHAASLCNVAATPQTILVRIWRQTTFGAEFRATQFLPRMRSLPDLAHTIRRSDH